ncbi:hypothetical protein GCM10011380_25980 [Sphingomonas metalli]|uniref:Glycosyl transferase n=1 Tax=Sphingomonas metalli TaxID=1779358 RepID=A0A916WW76_9SPHN|nr:hypothetical protein GCM10011380_25980 [Sphingomonas metalli]
MADKAPNLHLLIYSPLPAASALVTELPNVAVRDTRSFNGSGWSVKPEVLLRTLGEAEKALWLDTDVIVSGDLERLIASWPRDAIVVGEEFRYRQPGGCSSRARAWGLTVARELDWMTNSGSLRVTQAHRTLLEAWRAMMADPRFKTAQEQPIARRETHLVGDQDVLAALLVSERFHDVPVHYIRNGPDMVQHCGANGFHVIDRLRTMFAPPPAFVHMLGRYKPWLFTKVPERSQQRVDYFNMVCFELSPFHAAAQPYARALGDPPWLARRTALARFLHAASLGNVPLRGLPLALAAWIAEWRRGGPPQLPGA